MQHIQSNERDMKSVPNALVRVWLNAHCQMLPKIGCGLVTIEPYDLEAGTILCPGKPSTDCLSEREWGYRLRHSGEALGERGQMGGCVYQ